MFIVYILLWLIIGWGIWYVVFYYRYQERKNVDALRETIKHYKLDNEVLQSDNDQLNDENNILRDWAQELKQKNDDLENVVAELNRYMYNIKKWWVKARELAQILDVYDDEIEKRVKKIMWTIQEPDSQQDDEEQKSSSNGSKR